MNMRGLQWHVIYISFLKNGVVSTVLLPEIKEKGGQQMYSVQQRSKEGING
jgi:hypothetical protein